MQKPSQSDIEKSVAGNKNRDKLFAVLGLLSTFIGMLTLAALLADLAIDGLARLKPHFFTSFPSRFAGQAGILSAWVGTILVMIVTAVTAIPDRRRRRRLSGGIRSEKLVHRADRDQHRQPRRGAVHRLWLDGAGPVCLSVRIRPERAVSGAHAGFADLADRHRRHPRIHPRRSRKHERSGLCPRRDKMANHQRSRVALLHGRHLDRRHYRPLSGHRRNRAVDYHRRS